MATTIWVDEETKKRVKAAKSSGEITMTYDTFVRRLMDEYETDG